MNLNKKVVLAYLGVLLALLLMAFYIKAPYIPTDEQFYINYARCFAGINNSCSYYGVPYGYSLVLIPFVFIKDAFVQFSSILYFNAFLVSGIFWLSYYYFRIIDSKNIDESIIFSLIISFFPGFFLIGKTVMTESIFILVLGITFLLLNWTLKKASYLNFFFLGFNAYYLFLIRANGIIVLFLFSILMIYLFFTKYRKYVWVFFLGILPLMFFDFYLRRFFFLKVDPYLLLNGKNLFMNLFNLEWIRNLFGNLSYIFLSSFLIVPLFLLNFFKKIRISFNISNFVFISAFLANLILVSILLVGADRADHHMYGRYLDAFLLPVMLMSISFVFSKKNLRRKHDLFIILFVLLISILFMFKLGVIIDINFYNVLSFSWIFQFFHSWYIFLFVILYLPISVFLFFRKKTYIFILLLFFLNSIFSFYFYFYKEIDNKFTNNALSSYINEIKSNSSHLYFDSRVYDKYFYHLYWYYFPNFKKLPSSYDFCSLNNGFLITNKNFECKNAYLLSYENHVNIALYTFDEKIYSDFKSRNRVVFSDKPVLNSDLKADIQIAQDQKFLNFRFLKVLVKNPTEEVWINYWASRYSKYEVNPVAVREYCYKDNEIVGEKRLHFDEIMFPGDVQEFSYFFIKPVCSKLELSVVQDGYSAYEPSIDIILK